MVRVPPIFGFSPASVVVVRFGAKVTSVVVLVVFLTVVVVFLTVVVVAFLTAFFLAFFLTVVVVFFLAVVGVGFLAAARDGPLVAIRSVNAPVTNIVSLRAGFMRILS